MQVFCPVFPNIWEEYEDIMTTGYIWEKKIKKISSKIFGGWNAAYGKFYFVHSWILCTIIMQVLSVFSYIIKKCRAENFLSENAK